MPHVQGFEKEVSVRARGAVGKPHGFGRAMFGFSRYGAEDIFFDRTTFGYARFGSAYFGDCLILSGVYHKNVAAGPDVIDRLVHIVTRNPRSVPQQAQRAKLADGVAAWQALTAIQKLGYNQRAVGKHMSGFNLFLREYMSSI